MTAPSTLVATPPPAAATQKFKKQPGESIRFKGNLAYSIGEFGIKNLVTGNFRLIECTVFLTNQRIVATKLRRYHPFGPLVWLIRAFFARGIVFSVPLSELASIKLDPKIRNLLVLQSTTGQEFKLSSNTLFNKQPQWLAALTSAVTECVPGTTAQQSESAVTFT